MTRNDENHPVDRNQVELTDGSPVTPDHADLQQNGQQKGYVVLTPEERAKGYVRPVRRTVARSASNCGAVDVVAMEQGMIADPQAVLHRVGALRVSCEP